VAINVTSSIDGESTREVTVVMGQKRDGNGFEIRSGMGAERFRAQPQKVMKFLSVIGKLCGDAGYHLLRKISLCTTAWIKSRMP
jgi:hypothetical protein